MKRHETSSTLLAGKPQPVALPVIAIMPCHVQARAVLLPTQLHASMRAFCDAWSTCLPHCCDRYAVGRSCPVLALSLATSTCIRALCWQQLPCRHRPAAAAQGLQGNKGPWFACLMDSEVVQQPQLALGVAICDGAAEGAWQQRCSAECYVGHTAMQPATKAQTSAR